MKLIVSNVTYRYPKTTFGINDIALSIGPGVYGLLGLNGAGKSTLLRTLAGINKPLTGDVVLCEGTRDINAYSHGKSYRSLIGYLPQDFGAYPNLTVSQMLNFICILKGVSSRKVRKKRVEHLLYITGLSNHFNQKLATFSGGMLQRYGIAQALANDPKLLILDEPTVGLDMIERDRFFDLLTKIGENSIVIFSSHTESDILQLCDQIAVMNNGELSDFIEPKIELKELEGKLWSFSSRGDIVQDSRLKLVHSCLKRGELKGVYYSEARNEEFTQRDGFLPVVPTLKEYFHMKLKSVKDNA